MGLFDKMNKKMNNFFVNVVERDLRESELEKTTGPYLNEELSKVIFWPGSVESYMKCYGHSVKVIDTGRRDRGIRFHRNARAGYRYSEIPYKCSDDIDITLKKHLVERGIEALVECNFSRSWGFDHMYGLPVAKI